MTRPKTISVCLLLGLAGCVPPKQAEPVIQPVTVEVPIPVPCHITVGPKPRFTADHSALDENIHAQAKTLLVDREQRKAWEAQLEAGVKGCNGGVENEHTNGNGHPRHAQGSKRQG